MNNKKIGIIDSGVGGLTVVQKLRENYPSEDILYLGDNINVPYGNKSEEELYRLSKNIIDYLIEEDVKLIGVACNTISSIVEKYFKDYPVAIISIIDPVSHYVGQSDIKEVGLLGTIFTINSGIYNEKIAEINEDINITPEGCPTLAKVIDEDEYSQIEIENIVDMHLKNIEMKNDRVEDIILGCTHYPIIKDIFMERGKNLNFIDPAKEQVSYIGRLLEKEEIFKDKSTRGRLDIVTSGELEIYEKITKKLNIDYDSIGKIILE